VKIISTSALEENSHILGKRFDFEDLASRGEHGIKFAVLLRS
jgi:hypothetical protein